MKKKYQAVVAKSVKPTAAGIFSPFNIANVHKHVEQDVDYKFSTIKSLEKQLIRLAKKDELSLAQIIDLLTNLLQMSVIRHYSAEDISPKMLIVGLTMLKASHEFASKISVQNGIMNSIDNLSILDKSIKDFSKEYGVPYAKLGGLSKKLLANSD